MIEATMIEHVPSDQTIVPSARPFHLDGRVGSPAVLMLHGYTGYPGHLRYLAERLNRLGYSVSVPRLPGHGTGVADFEATSWRDWLRAAIDRFIELRSEYPTVGIVGFSMGGVLAGLLAGHFGIETTALIAPAYQVRRSNLRFAPLVRPFVRRIPKPPRRHPDDGDPDRQFLRSQYGTHHLTKGLSSFLHLQRLATRRLPYLRSDVFVVLSEKDETVDPSVDAIIRSRSNARSIETMMLHESRHDMADGPEKEELADALCGWFTVRLPIPTDGAPPADGSRGSS